MTVFTARPDERLDIGKAGARRIRILSRVRIERSLVGSGLLHLLLLLAILLLMLPAPPKEPSSSNPVTVIFEPSLPGSRKDQPDGQPPASAPEEGPQVPPPPGNEAAQPPSPPPAPPPAPPAALPVPPIPAPEPAAPPVQAIPEPPMPTPPVPEATEEPQPPPPPQATEAAPQPAPPPKPRAEARARPPIPQAAPQAAVPPRPRVEPRPRAEPRPAAPPAEPSLSAPMNFSFGSAVPDALRSRPTGRRNTLDPTIGSEVANRVGAPPTDTHRPDASMKITNGAQVGSDWMTMLHAWWNQHGRYPEQAARLGEDGTVRIHVAINRYGRVLSVELIQKSSSQWLDMGATGTFRDRTNLPPFPPSTPEPVVELDLTIMYILYRR